MPIVILSLGTNTGDPTIIHGAQSELENILSDVRHSTILSTLPIGMSGGNFLNSLTMGKTTLSTDELTKFLKALEKRFGNKKSLRRKGIVILDIDLLEYDGQHHHESDWQRDYVKYLMTELLKKDTKTQDTNKA